MKFFCLIFCLFLLPHDSTFNSLTYSELQKLHSNRKIDDRQHSIHKKQTEFRNKIDLQSRIDSMKVWNLDILYIEEFAFKNDSFLVLEYYFSSEKEAKWQMNRSFQTWDVYEPDKYYENGKPVKRYFFYDLYGKENISSIRKHMKSRKVADEIDPINKRLIIHAGCGMTWKYMKYAREKAHKEYIKPQVPDYYLIETFIEPHKTIISFQKPVKTKIKPIVEGTSF